MSTNNATTATITATDTLYPLEYSKTQRGRVMLLYAGYRYVENRQSTKNKFWRCSRYVKFGCRATIVTSKNPDEHQSVRLAGLPHSHEPEKQAMNSEKPSWQSLAESDGKEQDTANTTESVSDGGGIVFDLLQKSLFTHPDTSDFFVIDID